MSGPFPGMDPYLEDPARWPDVHQGIISAMRAVLNAILPAGYVANMGERCQVIPSEPLIEIRNVADQRRVVTIIEVLSPANKEAGSEGRRRYRQKQQELLASRTHLIEIDLLRAG